MARILVIDDELMNQMTKPENPSEMWKRVYKRFQQRKK